MDQLFHGLTSDYLYGGAHRLAFYFSNPNLAGALLGIILPFLWITYSNGRVLLISLSISIAELGIAFGIGLTYSRGAWVAWVSSLALFAVATWKVSAPKAGWTLFYVHRVIVILAVTLSTGLWNRIKESPGDLSVLHRLELWKGALQLIAASPIYGWGAGEAGLAFRHWIQSTDSYAVYGGVVNSYLHISVEYGLLVFAALLCIFIWPVVIALIGNKNRFNFSRLSAAGSTGIALLMIANIFSTLWINQSMRLALVIVWLLTIYFSLRAYGIGRCGRCMVYSVLVSAFVVLGLYTLGRAIQFKQNIRLNRQPGGTVELCFPSSSSEAGLVFLPDYRVFGPLYGKSIRDIAAVVSQKYKFFRIIPPSMPYIEGNEVAVVVMGYRAKELAQINKSTLLVAPSCRALKVSHAIKILLLPENDEFYVRQGWENLCKQEQVNCLLFPGTGQDIWQYRSLIAHAIMEL